MSLYLEKSFLNRMSFTLLRFKWIKPDVARFRCPYCGDSTKSSVKARGYVFINEKHDGYVFNCKNCGVGRGMYDFLKDQDEFLWKEFIVERLKERGGDTTGRPAKEVVVAQGGFMARMIEQTVAYQDPLEDLPRLSSLPDSHPAVAYMMDKRKFTRGMLERLFYAADFNLVALNIDKTLKEEQAPHDKRIIIPFYHPDGKLKCIQGRALDPKAMRYITVKTNEDVDKIFGLERVDQARPQLVFEGPFDSMFFPNAVATCDSALTKYASDQSIYVWDNQPRNKEIVKRIEQAIAAGCRLVIWGPDCPFQGKDANEMIVNGADTKDILRWMATHTFRGLTAALKFNEWKSV